MMINSTERFIQNLRWMVIFFLNPNDKPKKETYWFKSTKTPPPVPDLKPFEDEVIDMIKNIEFDEKKTNPFQEKVKAEMKEIRNEPKLIIAADKTSNFYKVSSQSYSSLLERTIQK